MSIYKKVVLSVIPPLSFLNTFSSSDGKKKHEEANEEPEEEDVASTVDGKCEWNILASLHAYAGMDILRQLTGKSKDDLSEKEIEQPSEYEDTATEEIEDGKSDHFSSSESDDTDSISSDDADDAHDVVEATEANDANEVKDTEEEDEQKRLIDYLMDSFLSGDFKDFRINEANFTVLQRSLIDNTNPLLQERSTLMRLNDIGKLYENDNEEETEKIRTFFRYKIANKLKSVFDMDDDEYIYANFNVWLVRDVMLQGHIYLSNKSILFYSFLPKIHESAYYMDGTCTDNSYDIVQTGPLGMKTTQYVDTSICTPIKHRFWGVLRPETLSIYNSSSKLYFPVEVIDLKSCISAEVINNSKLSKTNSASPKSQQMKNQLDSVLIENHIGTKYLDEVEGLFEKTREHSFEGVSFRIRAKKKSYRLFCDNMFTATRWVNNITKLIFLLHNSNRSNQVIMKIPIDNIILYDIDHTSEALSEKNEKGEKGPNKDDESLDIHSLAVIRHMENSKDKVKRRNRFSKKASSRQNSPYTEDSYFIFFRHGDTFGKYMREILSNNSHFQTNQNHDTSTINDLNHSDKFFNQEYVSSGSIQVTPSVSTLSQNNIKSLFGDLISSSKKHDSQSCGRERSPRAASDLLSVKRIGKTLTSPTRALSPTKPKRTELQTDFLSIPRDSTKNKGPTLLNFLSTSSLKKLDMELEASFRKFDNVYESNEILDMVSKNKKSADTKSISDALIPRLSMRDVLKSSPLGLSDFSAEDMNRGTNKFKYIKQYLRGISLINKWGLICHYDSSDKTSGYYVESAKDREIRQKHFQEHFSFNADKTLVATYYAHLFRSIPVFGTVYLGMSELCFRSLLPGVSTKMILPLNEIIGLLKEKGLDLAYSGLIINTTSQSNLFLEFYSQKARDDCLNLLHKQIEQYRKSSTGAIPFMKNISSNSKNNENKKKKFMERIWQSRVESARLKLFEDRVNLALGIRVPLVLELSPIYHTEAKTATSYNFVFLTIGSRGDVQPYIALGKGLQAEGHKVTIATHEEFETWIVGHNIGFKKIAGNPAELMALMVEYGTVSLSFLREAKLKFSKWVGELLESSWKACQGADILIESPSAMGGIHIAEALRIPYMRAFTMPWTRTRAYPHAFIVPDKNRGGSYNYLTHVLFEAVFWKGISYQVNKWRVEVLGLQRTNLIKMAQSKVPFIYNVSPTVLPPSVDFPDWVKVSGYWFLDEGAQEYTPPSSLVEFIKTARNDGKKLVYIGFGSITVKDAPKLTNTIFEAVVDADVRCILVKGWSDRLSANKNSDAMAAKPPLGVFLSESIPHDWLFPQMDLTVHHGGSGTTGASLKAGVPLIIKPFFGDQFFYASQIEKLGVGLALRKLNRRSLAKAILNVISNHLMREKTKMLASKISLENGVSCAIEEIYAQLEYARLLSLTRLKNSSYPDSRNVSGIQTPLEPGKYSDSEEEDDEDDDMTGIYTLGTATHMLTINPDTDVSQSPDAIEPRAKASPRKQ